MEFCEGISMGVGIGEGEFGIIHGTNGLKYVEGPAAHLSAQCLEGPKTVIGAADFFTRSNLPLLNYVDVSISRNLVEKDIAADPSCAPSCRPQWFAPLKSREREGKLWNEHEGLDFPRQQVIVQDVQIGRPVFNDCQFHLRVGRV